MICILIQHRFVNLLVLLRFFRRLFFGWFKWMFNIVSNIFITEEFYERRSTTKMKYYWRTIFEEQNIVEELEKKVGKKVFNKSWETVEKSWTNLRKSWEKSWEKVVGYNGCTGYIGYTGYTGYIGYTGYTGYTGYIGYTGYRVTPVTWVTLVTGVTPETWVTGVTWVTGKKRFF